MSIEMEVGIYKWQNISLLDREDFYTEMRNNEYKFINPDRGCLKDLEKDYEEFMSEPYDRRKRSSDIMIKYINCDNLALYNQLKNLLSIKRIPDKDITLPDDILSEAAGISDVEEINRIAEDLFNNPDIHSINIEAEHWMSDTRMTLIPFNTLYSKSDLEQLLYCYNIMIHRHRICADAKSIALYGLNVHQVYDILMARIDSNDNSGFVTPDDFIGESVIPGDVYFKEYAYKYFSEMSGTEFIEFTKNAMKLSDKKFYMETIVQGVTMDDLLSKYDDAHNPDVAINYGDLPTFTPDQMIDMGVYSYGPNNELEAPDDDKIMSGSDILEWFKEYNLIFNGFPINESYDKLNNKRLKAIQYYLITHEKTEENSKHLMQLGWHPNIAFTPENRVKNDKHMRAYLEFCKGSSKIIDLCGLGAGNISPEVLKEEVSVDLLQPIFLVFEGADSAFANAIKFATNGPYSHASISFDPTFRHIYSYAVNGSSNGVRGGFAIEDIKDKDPDFQLGIYCIFVDNDIFKKIKDNVEYFHQNMKSTSYAYANILSILFKIPFERSKELICSQFVDRMLKVGGIDITHKSSSLVDPNFLRNCTSANKCIYRLFEGKVKSFHPGIIASRLAKISRNPYKMQSEIIGTWNTPMPKFETTIDTIQEGYIYADDITRKLYRTVYNIDPIRGTILCRETIIKQNE